MTVYAGMGGGRQLTWSLAMIVRDAEPDIGNVLDDVALFCDEFVVVDTGSRDDTKTIASQRGARVIDFPWVDDFAAARNVSFDHCQGQWILWLLCDDRIPPAAEEGFLRLKAELTEQREIAAVMIPYRKEFSANDPTTCTFSFERERCGLHRRGATLGWSSARGH